MVEAVCVILYRRDNPKSSVEYPDCGDDGLIKLFIKNLASLHDCRQMSVGLQHVAFPAS